MKHEQPWSVSELNQNAKIVLEQNFAFVWVQGEISNLVRPKSGHLYFSIKDNQAQINCVWLKFNHSQHTPKLMNGKQWWFKGKISLYCERGSFQLIVSYAEEFGLGAKQILLEQKKAELMQKGWLSEQHKQPLPKLACKIALVTSATGAAVHDMIKVIRRRMPATKIHLFACMVQGNTAAHSIQQAIILADQSGADVIIVGRGGGSIEDLWAYNEDPVITAIFQAKTPIISGIGHESDHTLSELVADFRAATPSAAALAATRDAFELMQKLDQDFYWLKQKLNERLQQAKLTLKVHKSHCKSPKQLLEFKQELIQHSLKQIQTSMQNKLSKHAELTKAFSQQIPQIFQSKLQQQTWQFAKLIEQLELLNPLNILKKGYAVIYQGQTPINDFSQLKPKEQIQIKTIKKTLNATIDDISDS